MRQRTQLRERKVDGILDQPADLKPGTVEISGEQGSLLLGVGKRPLRQKYGEMSRSVYLPAAESTCSNNRWAGPISANPTRCTMRGCRNVNGVAATQPTMATTIVSAKTVKPIQLSSSRPP
jgi:hypothetical protein